MSPSREFRTPAWSWDPLNLQLVSKGRWSYVWATPSDFSVAKLSHPLISFYLCSLKYITQIHSALFFIAVKSALIIVPHRVVIKWFKY